MKVVWSDTAKLSYNNLVDFLIEQWEKSIVADFEKRVSSLVELIAQNSRLCPVFNEVTQLRRCVFHPNASLYYILEKDKVVIIAVIDNRMNIEF